MNYKPVLWDHTRVCHVSEPGGLLYLIQNPALLPYEVTPIRNEYQKGMDRGMEQMCPNIREPLYSSTGDMRELLHFISLDFTANERAPSSLNGKNQSSSILRRPDLKVVLYLLIYKKSERAGLLLSRKQGFPFTQ